jgi:RimJ/RimL family protein N-acetyltransferase
MLKASKSLPQKIDLAGQYCRLEYLRESLHSNSLWLSAGKYEDIWTYLLDGPWHDENQFHNWIKTCESHQIRHYYAIIDLQSEQALGALCLLDCNIANATTEIGGIFFSPQLQKTRIATEAVFILSNYAFELGYRRLQWKCNTENEASKKAAKRFGFTSEGLLRQHMITKGKSRDTALFSVIDKEWPKRKMSFEKWLDEKNFNDDGKQRLKLEDC